MQRARDDRKPYVLRVHRLERTRSTVFGPAGAGAALAFVHGSHSGDRNRTALFDQVVGQGLRRRHRVRPRRVPVESVDRGVDREVAGSDAIQIRPIEGKRHRCTRPESWAVRRGDSRAAGSGGVHEDLSVAVLDDESRRRQDRDPGPRRARRAHGSPRQRRPVPNSRRSARRRARLSRRWSSPHPYSPQSVKACRTRWATATTAAKSSSPGGSRSRIKCVGW